MGQSACQMVLSDPELELVAVLDPFESASDWQGIPVFNDKNDLAGCEQMYGLTLQHQLLPMKIHALLLKMALLQ